MDDIAIFRLVVFLMREFSGWSLEYTTNLVKTLPLYKLNALIEETNHQKALDDYRQASYSAMIVATLASDKQHRRSVQDVIGEPPTRGGESQDSKLETLAQKEGILLPKE